MAVPASSLPKSCAAKERRGNLLGWLEDCKLLLRDGAAAEASLRRKVSTKLPLLRGRAVEAVALEQAEARGHRLAGLGRVAGSA